jgi:hypothetical protein
MRENQDQAVIVTGEPGDYAAASLEAECYRLGPGGDQ